MVQPLCMKLLETMTNLISLKAWQYIITNKILNVWKRRVLMMYFTSNWLLVYAISVILVSGQFTEEIIQSLHNFLSTLPTQHVDFILGDFNEDSFNDGPIKCILEIFCLFSSCFRGTSDQTLQMRLQVKFILKMHKTSFPFLRQKPGQCAFLITNQCFCTMILEIILRKFYGYFMYIIMRPC